MRTVLSGATVIDGAGGPAVKNASVVIDGEHIWRWGRPGLTHPPEAGSSLYQLDGRYTIIPGLIDCHDHVGHPGLGPAAHRVSAVPHAVAIVARALRETVEAGVTTVRDSGGLGYGFKAAVDEGLFAARGLSSAWPS